MRRPLLRAAVPALLLCLAGRARAAEAFRMSADAQRALHQLDEALEQLSRARAAMAALEAGEQPKGSAKDWSSAPALLLAGAEALRRSAGPVLPEPDDGGVPLRQLRSCSTRPDALVRLERRHRALLAAAQRGADTRAALRERLAAAQAAEEARRALVKSGAARGAEAAMAEAFPWRWADLEGPAAAALASYAGEVRRYLERVDRNATEQRALAAEAADQLATWGRARDCLLAGSWSGTRALAGSVSGLSAQLVSTGDSWSGTVTLDGASVPVRSVTLHGTAVTIGLADGRGTLSGSLSPDGKGLKGNLSSPDGLASFQLRRQQ
jgi:hypothetical protein